MFNISVFVGITTFLASCTAFSNGVNSSTMDSTKRSVKTRSPNTDYKPAFAGQTRIAGVKTATPYEGKIISSSLNNPWGIANLPDGRLLITEKGGSMRIATIAGQLSEAISGLPRVNSSGQGGLLGLTIDPQFSNNRIVYWVFSENTTGAPCIMGDVSCLMLQVISSSAPGPFIHSNQTPGTGSELYSYGHRNVQGLAFHPQTGDLWENEFGPRGGDELNLIKPGKNYGWPDITYGLEYSGEKVGPGITQKSGMEQPVYYWDPVLSPSGMTFYNGTNMTEWKNNLFITGLNSNHIARLIISNNKVVGEERILANERQCFRDVTQGKDGALYAVTDEGRLYRIARKE